MEAYLPADLTIALQSLLRLAALSQEASAQAQLKQSLAAAVNKTAALQEVGGAQALQCCWRDGKTVGEAANSSFPLLLRLAAFNRCCCCRCCL